MYQMGVSCLYNFNQRRINNMFLILLFFSAWSKVQSQHTKIRLSWMCQLLITTTFISGDGFSCYHTSNILALPTVLYDG